MGEIDRRYFDALMADKKLSLRGLATLMGMGHSQLSLTFSGARRMQVDEAAQLSQIFGEPIHRIIEASGVSVRPETGRRVPVIGAVDGSGIVTPNKAGVVERTSAPEDLVGDIAAVQYRTAGTPLAWADGAVSFFKRPSGIDPALVGRFCYLCIKDGPEVVGTVFRGYRENTYNVQGIHHAESVPLAWATPMLMTRH